MESWTILDGLNDFLLGFQPEIVQRKLVLHLGCLRHHSCGVLILRNVPHSLLDD